MQASTAKEELRNAIRTVFNINTKLEESITDSYQEGVLYVRVNTIRSLQRDNDKDVYYISGMVFLDASDNCSFNKIGILTDRVKDFGKLPGLYFAMNETLKPPMTTLDFEFYSKPLGSTVLAKDPSIEDIDNKVTGEY